MSAPNVMTVLSPCVRLPWLLQSSVWCRESFFGFKKFFALKLADTQLQTATQCESSDSDQDGDRLMFSKVQRFADWVNKNFPLISFFITPLG